LRNLFLNKLEDDGLVDVAPIKMVVTWRNMRIREAGVEKD